MNRPKTLLIFNGDYAYDCWKRTAPTADLRTLVWRENYLEGPLPADVPLEEFERVRAEFLHSCVPEYSEKAIYDSLIKQHIVLNEFNAPDCKIILFFDCCMYDMIMLARIFYLLKNTPGQIRLFCENVQLGNSPDVFRQKISSLREIPRDIQDLYVYAWECVLQGPHAVTRFNVDNTAPNEPFLAEAMHRYGEDHPCDGSLGRSQRQLLEIIRSGISAFDEIFQTFDKYEKYMFMGDTHCLRLLEQLAEQKLISMQNSGGTPVFHVNNQAIK